jgi:hypothetical protein
VGGCPSFFPSRDLPHYVMLEYGQRALGGRGSWASCSGVTISGRPKNTVLSTLPATGPNTQSLRKSQPWGIWELNGAGSLEGQSCRTYHQQPSALPLTPSWPVPHLPSANCLIPRPIPLAPQLPSHCDPALPYDLPILILIPFPSCLGTVDTSVFDTHLGLLPRKSHRIAHPFLEFQG